MAASWISSAQYGHFFILHPFVLRTAISNKTTKSGKGFKYLARNFDHTPTPGYYQAGMLGWVPSSALLFIDSEKH
jgi:hypothetical protein